MANPAGLSIEESSVYRGIYNVLGNTAYQSDTERFSSEDHGRFVDVSKWTFVQKLLAIEQFHERRRIERVKRKKDRESPIHKNDKPDQTTGTVVPDLLSRWLHHQVVCDSSEEPTGSHNSNRSQNLLPALNKTDQSVHLHKQTRPSIASPVFDSSDNNAYMLSQSVMDDVRQLASVTDTMTRTSSLSYHTSIQGDEDVSVIKPTRKRQLRLPPILLPRMYTVAPRPLKSRDFLTPTKIRGPITDEEWEELKDCRYIRHGVPRFSLQVSPSNNSHLQYYTDLT